MDLAEGVILVLLLDLGTKSGFLLVTLLGLHYCLKKQFPNSNVELLLGPYLAFFLVFKWDPRIPAFFGYFLVASLTNRFGHCESSVIASLSALSISNYHRFVYPVIFPLAALYAFTIFSSSSASSRHYRYGQLLGLAVMIVAFSFDVETQAYVWENIGLILYFMMVCVFTVVLVAAANYFTVSKTVQRKIFHFALVLIFVPGLANKTFLSFVFLSSLYVLLVIESLRSMVPFIHNILIKLVDEQDSCGLILNHIYLLVGFGFPVVASCILENELVAWSGIISLGVGDAISCLVGKWFGKIKVPYRQKTVEGMLAGFISMCGVLHKFELLTPSLTAIMFLVSVYESYTKKVDNLVLPVLTFSLISIFS